MNNVLNMSGFLFDQKTSEISLHDIIGVCKVLQVQHV